MKHLKLILIISLFGVLVTLNTKVYAVVKTTTGSGLYNDPIWTPAGTPATSDEIVILNGHTVTLNLTNKTVRKININAGGTLNNGGFNITVTGGSLSNNYLNNGIHNIGTNFLIFTFDNRINGSGITNGNILFMSGTIDFVATCSLTINGNIISPNVSYPAPFNGTGVTNGNFAVNQLGNIIVNGDIFMNSNGGSAILLNFGTITQTGTTSIRSNGFIENSGIYTINGNLNIGTDAGDFNYFQNNPNGILNLNGDLLGMDEFESFFFQEVNSISRFGGQVFPPSNNGSLNVVGISPITFASTEPNIVEYNGGTNQIIKDPTDNSGFGYDFSTYSNLIISNNNVKSLSNNIIVKGDLTITGNAQLDVTASSYNIELKGSWINTSLHSNPFIERLGLVTFNGSIAQTISTNLAGGETFYNLTINNTSTGLTQLDNNINVSNILSLTSGFIHTSVYETNVTNTALTAVTNYSTSSYVDGYLRRALLSVSGIYDFPVGNSTAYELATVNFTAAHTVSNLLVNFSNLVSGSGLPLVEGSATYFTILNCGGTASGVGNVNDGVWTITPNAGTAIYDLTLQGRNYSNAAAGNTIVKRTNVSSSWNLLGSYIASTGNEPLIAQRTGISEFSQFAIASSVIALPITLLDFSGKNGNNQNHLFWTTASEINNDFFTVEKSVDVVNFEPIGTVKGAGNSNTIQNYKYVDAPFNLEHQASNTIYYRLKQTDFDGTSTYSDVVVIKTENDNKEQLQLYPNPVINSIQLNTTNEIKEATISNALGVVVYQNKLLKSNAIDVSNFKKGIYYITIKFENETVTQKFIKQ